MHALAHPMTAADLEKRIHVTLPSFAATNVHAVLRVDRTSGVLSVLPVAPGALPA